MKVSTQNNKKDLKTKALEIKQHLATGDYLLIAVRSKVGYDTVKATFSERNTRCTLKVVQTAIRLIKAREAQAEKLSKQTV